jgi:hypothetical protein
MTGTPDFSHLKALEQKDDAVPYRFEQIGGNPTIWFRPGTDANKQFMNETLRRANARARGGRRSRRTTLDTIAAARQEDREVLSKTCAVRWDVKDAKGKDVEFSYDNCLAYFEALPDWLFDEVRAFVIDPGNFVEDEDDGGAALGEASPQA